MRESACSDVHGCRQAMGHRFVLEGHGKTGSLIDGAQGIQFSRQFSAADNAQFDTQRTEFIRQAAFGFLP